MGTHMFAGKGGKSFTPSGTNLQARAGAAGGYAGGKAGAGAQKNISSAISMFNKHPLKPSTKTAAVDAPGPKKV